jgi:2'-5' RNA ligase
MNSQLTLFSLPSVPAGKPAGGRPPYRSPLSQRCQYLAVISPSPSIYAAVDAMKSDLDRMCGGNNKWRWSKPHITLFTLKAARSDEDLIRELLQVGCSGNRPFNLHFRGYGHFVETRTVFVDPVEKATIDKLRFRLQTLVQRQQGLGTYEIQSSLHPHMTIGKGLFRPGQFLTALRHFQGRPYSATMHVDHVLLLRRSIEPLSAYRPVSLFRLGPSTDHSGN